MHWSEFLRGELVDVHAYHCSSPVVVGGYLIW